MAADEHAALAEALAALAVAPAQATIADPRTGAAVTVGISQLDLQRVVGYLIKNPSSQRLLRTLLPALRAGQVSAVAPLVMATAAEAQGMRGMPEAMDAASGASRERLALIRREAPGTLLEDTLNYPGVALAEPLGVPDLGDAYRAPLVSAIPTLLLSGTLDGRTYVDDQRALAAGLTRSTHVLVEGAGHDLFLASPEVVERIATFLAGGAVSAAPIVAAP